jgi:arylsulfatase A-like enzyme
MKVIVVNVRGLHLGYVSAYGNEWIDTPAFDRLAAEGVVFDNHFADRPDSAGARRAWRTGRYDFALVPDRRADAAPLADLVGLLKDAGAVTSLVLDASRPAPAEFAAGWDVVIEAEADDEATALDYALEGAAQALESLAETGSWLLWLDLATLVPPWDVPDEFLRHYVTEDPEEEDDEDEDESEALVPLPDPPMGRFDPDDELTFLRLQGTYAAAVAHLDAALGVLLKELEGRRLLDEVLLILTTDHGLPLGEHGVVGPDPPRLHEELVHLPLMMRLPRAEQAGRRVPALTQPVDLAPTLLDAFGLPPAPMHGHSLLPLARGEAENVRDYACSGLRVGENVGLALRSPAWSFVLPVCGDDGGQMRLGQLYVRPDDRGEVNDVIQHHQELANHLEAVLTGFVEATRRPGSLQPPELRDVEAEQPTTDTPGSPS